MRVGDFSVEVVPYREGTVRELETGHVLARPGQIYTLRLRNHGPLRAVAEIDIDGKSVTDSRLVLRPWSVTELERPLRDSEHGRFTVIAEGNERVFGLDGGRDNESLGVIRVSFRRELRANLRPSTRWTRTTSSRSPERSGHFRSRNRRAGRHASRVSGRRQ